MRSGLAVLTVALEFTMVAAGSRLTASVSVAASDCVKVLVAVASVVSSTAGSLSCLSLAFAVSNSFLCCSISCYIEKISALAN
jgi:hypothetical protein